MGSNNIFVREYIASLKEDSELDYLFPILLNLMGFKIKSTPKHSKGQSQYGKDVIAVGIDEKGIKKRFYFEIKGYSDKDFDDVSFNKKDGIRDSILASKDAPFVDKSDMSFNSLPIEIVTVHNGIIKENFRIQFNGFIEREFKDGGFQDWDIYKLTELFSKFLFSEYLLTDEDSHRLFKRTLVLLDAPEYNYSDFKQLVDLQLSKVKEIKGRAFTKLFATLNLLSGIILHYSKENENLYPARECISYLLLKTWAWVLRNKLENKIPVKKEFIRILKTHFEMLDLYFKKTLPAIRQQDGLYSERGGYFETIGYPIRCFDYLNYLVYYFEARQFYPNFNRAPSIAKEKKINALQKELLIEIITNNMNGCSRPLFDNHSLAILNVILFLLKSKELQDEEQHFIGNYLIKLCEGIMIIKLTKDRFPELSSNESALVEFVSTHKRPLSYEDRSSLLITILFELVSLLDMQAYYPPIRDRVNGKINLQVAYPNIKDFDIEQSLFEKKMENEYYVESSIKLPNKSEEFKEIILKKETPKINYRTDIAGFPFLRTLAHIYFKNEFFPDEWRDVFNNKE